MKLFPRAVAVLSLLTLVSCSRSANDRADNPKAGSNDTTVAQTAQPDDQQQLTPATPPRQKKYVTEFDGLSIEWIVGEPVVLESVTHLLGVAPGALKLSAEEGARLIGIPFGWDVPDDTPDDMNLVIGNLMFQAVDGDGRSIRASAFALGDCSEQVMWLVPDESSGLTFPLDHLTGIAVENFSPAFLFPNDWKSAEIHFGPIDGKPILIGSVTLPPAQSD